MNDIISIEELKKFSKKQLGESYIKTHHPKFYSFLTTKYSYVKTHQERIYLYINNLSQPGTCKVCGKPTKFQNGTVGYRNYCCPACNNRDPDKIKKQQQTTLKHYGVLNPSKNKDIQKKIQETFKSHYGSKKKIEELINKRKNTCLERYGEDSYTKTKEYKKYRLEKYGFISPFENKDVQYKSQQTKLERYGNAFYTNTAQSIQTCLEKYGSSRFPNIEQAKQTKLEQYGDENYNNKEKSQQTKLERYGDENYNNREKSKQTNIERYGTSSPIQNKDVLQHSIKTRQQNHINSVEELIDYDEYGNWIIKCPHEECNKCTEKCFISPRRIYYDRKRLNLEVCTKLLKENANHIKNTSIELFIQHILDKYNIEYQTNVRDIIYPKEIDIYIPSKKIAIECNGIRFHSTQFQSNYKCHYNKWIECKNKDIQLLTIWEDEIIIKPQIVESIILSKLGIYQERIYARQCKIKEVSSNDSVEFLHNNHIQGECNASIRLGLYYEDKLVSIMTFSKRRGLMGSKKHQNGEWELSRFCNKLNTQIIGGASKLFTYFIKHFEFESIYSFSSNDISNGQLYKLLKFRQMGENISYWYVNKNTMERIHRSKFSKSNIVKLGIREENNKSWTESEVALEQGLYKIYDSGQISWRFV